VGPVLGRKELCPVCNDIEAWTDLGTQEDVSYKLLPLEHHEETRFTHPIDEDTNL
jgi:hypothetical protein